MTDEQLDVYEDPELTPEEKETTIRFGNTDERLHIASEQASIVSWLQEHPEFIEEDRRVIDGALCYLNGTLPVGALLLKGKSRNRNHPSGVLGTLDVKQDND